MSDTSDLETEAFAQALQLPAGARTAYLAEVCGGDSAMRARLEALLRIEDRVGDFLAQPAPGLAGGLRREPAGDTSLGWVGRYRLLEKIGEGGCGVIYLAEQSEPVRRQVALKIIKPGM